jgi:hypothetical protein
MKIFWSSQSDSPGKTGRYFVRDALLDAIRRPQRNVSQGLAADGAP